MKPLRVLRTCLTTAILSIASANCQPTTATIPFQGLLADQSGAPIADSASLTLVFRLYDTPVGGDVKWEETQQKVVVVRGRFNALLGSVNPLPSLDLLSNLLYLGITVDDGTANTTDIEMRPRQALVPVPAALLSRNSLALNGHDWGDLLVAGRDPTIGKVRADKLALNETTFQVDSSLSLSLKESGVTDHDIADGAITTNKVAIGAIDAGRIAPAAITAGKIALGAVTQEKIALGAVTQEKRGAVPYAESGCINFVRLAGASFPWGSLTDLASGSVSIRTSGRPVLIAFATCSNGSNSASSIWPVFTSSNPNEYLQNRWQVFFVRDVSTVIGAFDFIRDVTMPNNLSQPITPLSLDTPSAGQHTYKIQLQHLGDSRGELWISSYKLVVLEL